MKKNLNILLAFITLSTVLNAINNENVLPPEIKSDRVGWLKYHNANDQKSRLAKAAAKSDRKAGTHNGNRVRTLFYNYGSIGKPSTEPSMEWPIGSGRGYAFEFGVIAGGRVKTLGGQNDIIVSDGLVTAGVTYDGGTFENNEGDWQPVPGFHDPFQASIAMSDALDEDRDEKPDSWPSSWYDPAFSDYMWPGEYGQGITTADQESYFVMDDYYIKSHNTYWPDQGWSDSLKSDEFYPDTTDFVRGGLGLQVESRGYQWIATRAQNVIFFVYELENVGTDTLDDMYFGMYGDPHVGGADDYNDDDAYFDTFIDIVYGWDDDAVGDPVFGTKIPGFFGYKFLESPGEPRNGIDDDDDGMVDESMQDGLDNDGDWRPFTDWNLNGSWDAGEPILDDTGSDGVGPDDPQYVAPDADGSEANGFPDDGEPNFDEKDLDEADQIGLTGFVVEPYTRQTSSEDIYYTRLSSGIDSLGFEQNSDNIFMYSSGPIKMAPNDVRRFSIAMLFGYNINAAGGEDLYENRHNVRDLYATADIMQEIYDAGYRFVKPPNKPRLTAVPGDGQVTLYWDEGAERSKDPLFGNDFEGYAIYRATDFGFNEALNITDTYGSPYLWNPIAKFDLENYISGPHPIEQIKNSGLHFDMGTNSGLVHSYVDKNLINGQRYFYAVCAYDSGSVNDTIPPTETAKTIQEDFTGTVTLDVNTAVVTPQAPALGYIAPEILFLDEGGSMSATGDIEFDIIDPTLVQDGRTLELRFIDSGMDLVDNDEDWESFSDSETLINNSPYVDMVISPTSDSTYFTSAIYDTLIQRVSLDTTFEHNNQIWKVKTWLEGGSQDTIVIFPDTVALGPTASIWDYATDGPVMDDVGSDGCSDEYENGDGSCSDTLLAALPGDDPNGDNWHPVSNPEGTEANGVADVGEPDLDAKDFDELSLSTQSFSLYDVTDSGNEIILMENQIGLHGEDFNQISNGLQMFIYNDTLMIDDLNTGWVNGDCYWQARAVPYNLGAYEGVPLPKDYEIEFFEGIADSSLESNHFLKNGPKLPYIVRDVTENAQLNILGSSDIEGLRPLSTHTITPYIYLDENQTGTQIEVDLMPTWEFSFLSPLDQIWSIFPVSDGVLVGTESSGLAIYNQDSQGWIFFDEETSGGGLLSEHMVKDIIYYEGYYWVATQSGPSIYDGEIWWHNHSLETLFDEFKVDSEATLEDPDKTKSFAAATGFAVDSLGYLWISTADEGLVRVKTQNTYLTSMDDEIVVYDDTISTSLSSLTKTKTNDIFIDGSIVWLATEKGIVTYDITNDLWHQYSKSDLGVSNDDFYAITKLSSEYESAIVFGGKGGLVFAMGDSFVVHGDSLLPHSRAYSLHYTGEDELYVGTHAGFAVIDLSGSSDMVSGLSSEHFEESWGDSTIYSSSKIRAITFSGETGYFGTEEGLEQRLSKYEWNSFGPQPGDVLKISTRKEFSSQDTYQFRTTSAKVDAALESNSLANVAVVPNPYVAAAIWERKPYLKSGRGERKIYFTHLPAKCTIRIYTMAGELVKKLEHESPDNDPDQTLFDGAEPWDLLNLDNLEVAYGVYIYHIETENDETIGKFAVIK